MTALTREGSQGIGFQRRVKVISGIGEAGPQGLQRNSLESSTGTRGYIIKPWRADTQIYQTVGMKTFRGMGKEKNDLTAKSQLAQAWLHSTDQPARTSGYPYIKHRSNKWCDNRRATSTERISQIIMMPQAIYHAYFMTFYCHVVSLFQMFSCNVACKAYLFVDGLQGFFGKLT